MNPGIFLGMLVFFPFAGALLCFVAGRKNALYRDYLSDILVVFEFLTALLLFVFLAKKASSGEVAASLAVPQVCGMGLSFEADGFRLIYAPVTSFMWMMTTILSGEYSRGHSNTNRYYLFLLLTLGATMGVFLSADLFTTFVFFEIMSFTSYVWVAQEETEQALRAAQTYLAVAVTGGMVLLMGVFLTYHVLGTGKISELAAAAAACKEKTVLYAAGGCMLFGFGAKAGAFPLHIWLPKAHPVAPAPASALLSGVLTKTGVYGIIILSANLFFGDGKWGLLDLAARRADYVRRCASGGILNRSEADTGMLFDVADRIYSGRNRHDGTFGRGISACGARHNASHGQPFNDQTGALHGGRRDLHEYTCT